MIRAGSTLDWELRGMQAAARRHRLDAFVTSQRAAAVRRQPSDRRVALRVARRTGSARTAGRGRLCGIERAMPSRRCSWRRSLRKVAAHVAFGLARDRGRGRSLRFPLAGRQASSTRAPARIRDQGGRATGYVRLPSRFQRSTRQHRDSGRGLPARRSAPARRRRLEGRRTRRRSAAYPTTSSSISTAARRFSSIRRCTRASATACSRRWHAEHRSWRLTRHRFRRSSAMPGSSATRAPSDDSRARSGACSTSPGSPASFRARGSRRRRRSRGMRHSRGLSAAIAAALS